MTNLFIVSPSYSGQFCGQYVESLAATVKDCMDHGIRTLHRTVLGVHWIDIARDIAAHVFLHTNCDFMLQIDDDLGWEQDAPRRMLVQNADILGGVYPLKTDLISEVSSVPNRVPGGFLMVRRDVIEQMTKRYEDQSYDCASLQYGKLKVAPLFQRIMLPGKGYIGEDFAFCDRAVECGFKVDTFRNIMFSHVGAKEWKGSVK